MRKLKKYEIKLLMFCQKYGYVYIARDDDENIWAFKSKPPKSKKFGVWCNVGTRYDLVCLKKHRLEGIVSWGDEEPTLIEDLLEKGKQ